MSYYPDLSPYTYGARLTADPHYPGHVNIGWLDDGIPFPTGNVSPNILARIGQLCTTPVRRYRGLHNCWWCGPGAIEEDVLADGVPKLMGYGEIHVSAGGIYWVYAAPMLIYHYILRHNYLPPQEFLDAVERLEPDYSMCCQGEPW